MRIVLARPIGYYLLILLLLFQGVSGLYGGFALIYDPSGAWLELPEGLLDDTFFPDYLVPGLILFTLLGMFPAAVFFGVLQRQPWSWLSSFLVGFALVIWIAVQIAMVGYQPEPPLQLIYGTIGVIILILVLIPSVREQLGH